MEQVRQTILLYARSSAAVLIEGETGTGKELAAQAIHRYARSSAAVLIEGETGTGKELAAQAIHREYFARHDARQGKKSHPFVAVNCGAIAESLLEAELFGYEEGAFTGSRRGGRAGLFEIAHGGTLFLDEIGEMPLPLQTRLLRVRHDARQGKKSHPFVAVNCGAIAESLLEAELFGYEEGAFTGSRRGGRAGLFEIAHGGTLFLDEIGEMPLPLQTRLLRVLEEKEVTRVGGHQPVPVDVRVISATHCNLEEDMRQGEFRRDLFYRLSILRLQLPPLRERVTDILPLAESFLKVSLAALSAPFSAALRQGLQASEIVLVHYDWPGNTRELRNMMERLALFLSVEPTPDLTPQFLQLLLPELARESAKTPAPRLLTPQQALEKFNGDKTAAANYLGISRTTFWRRLKS